MKKAVFVVLCLVMICVFSLSLAACNNKEPLKIVYLGDSIAEALLGPTPISERENYGYYAILGKCNGYVYHNRSVSGHKSDNMLEVIHKEDYGANMTNTHIRDADIIHISILGNDILLSGFRQMLIEAAEDKYDKVETILPTSRANIAAIVGRLKELNPDATIIFQTVYNPADPDSVLLQANAQANAELAAMGYTPEDYRGFAEKVMTRLNNVLWEYLEEHPGAFHIADVYKSFDEIYNADRVRGNRLIFPDGVHPSSEGHAQAAIVTQDLLVSLGLAEHKTFLKNYKQLRLDQLDRLYPQMANVKGVKKNIKKAKTADEVNRLYFDAILGELPSAN